jgi:hypothetical protein
MNDVVFEIFDRCDGCRIGWNAQNRALKTEFEEAVVEDPRVKVEVRGTDGLDRCGAHTESPAGMWSI